MNIANILTILLKKKTQIFASIIKQKNEKKGLHKK